ncbi:MAG: hypothetical protein KAU52_08020 [Methanosarcinales archaeon]|nr:hypothetical protein [Methanosarcinales archaeon]
MPPPGDTNHWKILSLGSGPIPIGHAAEALIMKPGSAPGHLPCLHVWVLVARPWQDAGGAAKSEPDHSIKQNMA